MTVLLRSFVVWCMLLALPYQGYAAAAMMACAPAAASMDMPAQAMPAGPHDHAAMLAAMAQQGAHAQHQPAQHDDGHAHGGGKCGGSACCIAGAPVVASLAVMPVLPAVSGPIALYSEFLPAVDLAHPERPPQAPFA